MVQFSNKFNLTFVCNPRTIYIQSIKPADVQMLFRPLPPMFWNILDADASLSVAKKFSVPKAVKDVYLEHLQKRK